MKKFGDWTFIEEVLVPYGKKNRTRYRCQCKCGDIYLVNPGNIKKGSNRCRKCANDARTPKMIGLVFENLRVVDFSHSDGNFKYYKCICSCGNERICAGSALRRKQILCCKECKRKKHVGHGMKLTSVWVIWMGMKARCNNPNNKAYKNYGGRGIKVCERWHKFDNFYADMGDRPDGLQLDRINNDGNYERENCRWTTPKVNFGNRRNGFRNKEKLQ